MPIKGQFTAAACVLFERPVSLDQLADVLSEFEVVKRLDEDSGGWALRGPSFVLAFRPDVNGFVSVDTVAHRWPDHMGDPQSESMLFGAWAMGNFGPFAFPNGLERAAQHSWGWADGKAMPQRHTAFVRVVASYVFGGDPKALIFPPDYDPLAELEFVTRVARAVLRLPGALCYFNPNGETLRSAESVGASVAFGDEANVPPLDVYSNVRLFNVDQGWLLMDTVGNGQLGSPDLPDLEVLVRKDKRYDLGEIDPFLRNTTMYVLRRGEVFRDGDTIDGPGGVRWRAWNRRAGLITPPRRTLRFFPEDGTTPPDVLFHDRTDES